MPPKLQVLILALLGAPTLLAQQIVALPILECADIVSKRGASVVASAAPAGAASISFTQPVPLGLPIILNPGAANQETVYITTYATNTSPYNGSLQSGQFGNTPATLAFAHSAGEPVTFESQEAAAYFGYFNPLSSPANAIAGSSSNFFSPGNPDRGQPSDFAVGAYRNQLALPIPTPRDLVWILGSQVVVARTTPELACTRPAPVLLAESQTVALGATTNGLRIGTVSGGAPGPYTVAVTGIYRRNPNNSAPINASEVSIANLRVQNGAIFADVSASAAATSRHAYFTLRVTDSANRNAFSTAFIETVNTCPMTVTPSVLTTAYVNTPYTVNFSATGAPAPITFALEGSLPVGLALSESGQLSGTPLQAGSFPIAIRSAAFDGCFQRTPLTLEVQGQLCSANVTSRVQVTLGGFRQNLVTRRFQQTVTLRNNTQSSIFGPVALVTDTLSANAALANANGATTCAAPLGRPYALAELGPNNLLAPGSTVSLNLEFTNSSPTSPITYTPRVIAGGAIR